MRFLRDNALSQFFLVIFAVALLGQSAAGWRREREERQTHGEEALSYLEYVRSSEFWQAVMENWQSEFLQFALYIVATVYLVQRGSNESKAPGQEGRESDEEQRVGPYATADSPAWARIDGFRRVLFSHSLVIAMTAIFLLSWFAHSLTGRNSYNDEQRLHGESPISWITYVSSPDFWETTLQNWQSEFLAIGTMAVFTIYLRARGSPESKPVGAPHAETASSG